MYAIFYKEWIKTRWYFLLAVVTTLGFTGYCMLRINRVIEMKGAAHVWEVMMQRDAIFIDMLQYIPLIVPPCLDPFFIKYSVHETSNLLFNL